MELAAGYSSHILSYNRILSQLEGSGNTTNGRLGPHFGFGCMV